MTIPTHIAAGAIISKLVPPLYPVTALVCSFTSHALLDEIPEYHVNWKNRKQILKHLPWILWWAFSTILIWLRLSDFGRWCVMVSLSPDIVDGIRSILRPKVWQTGDHIFPWHWPKGREPLSLFWTVVIEIVSIGIALAIIR